MGEKPRYVGIDVAHPFDSVLAEIGRLQEELWNSHIQPKRLELSDDAYHQLMSELGQSEPARERRGGASMARDRTSTVRGLEIGPNPPGPLKRSDIRLEGTPFRQ